MFQIVIPSTRKGPAWLACKKGVLGLVPLLGPWWALWAGGMGHPGSLSLVLDVKKTAGFRVPSLGGCPGRILHPWVGGWDGAAGCWGRARVGGPVLGPPHGSHWLALSPRVLGLFVHTREQTAVRWIAREAAQENWRKNGRGSPPRGCSMGPQEWVGQGGFWPVSPPIRALRMRFKAHGMPPSMLPTAGPLWRTKKNIRNSPLVAGELHIHHGAVWGAQSGPLGAPSSDQPPKKLLPPNPWVLREAWPTPAWLGWALGMVENFAQGGTTMAPPWPTFGGPYLHEYPANFGDLNCQALLIACTRRRRGHRGRRTRIQTFAAGLFPPALLHHGGPTARAVSRSIPVRF